MTILRVLPPPCRYQNGPGGGEKVWVWDVLAIVSFMDTLTWAKLTIPPPDWVRVFVGVSTFGRLDVSQIFFLCMDGQNVRSGSKSQKFVLG